MGPVNNNNFASTADPNARQATTNTGKLEWEQKSLANWDYRISGSIYKEHDKFTTMSIRVFFASPAIRAPAISFARKSLAGISNQLSP
jgi:hypothetical protein